MSLIQAVYDCACAYRLVKVSGGDVSATLDHLVSLVGALTAADVGLSDDAMAAPTTIECVNIIYDRHCSLTLFILPQNAALPLHDHPDMTVVTKIVRGRVRIRSYDWTQPPSTSPAPSLPPPKSGYVIASGDVIADDTTAPLVLTSRARELHEVVAVAASIMFDVITPPYDGTAHDDADDADGAVRLCHYFKEETATASARFLRTIPPPNALAFSERAYAGPLVMSNDAIDNAA